MTSWQGNTALYTLPDALIIPLSNAEVQVNSKPIEARQLFECHSQKSLLVIVWKILNDWWQTKQVRQICGTFAMKYCHHAEEITRLRCISLSQYAFVFCRHLWILSNSIDISNNASPSILYSFGAAGGRFLPFPQRDPSSRVNWPYFSST